MKCPLFRAVLALLPRPPLALTPRCAWAGRWCLSHIGDSLVAVTKPKLCDEPAGNAHRVGAVGVLSAGHAVSETHGMSPLGGHPLPVGSEPRGTAIKRSLARTRQHRYSVQFPEQSTRWAGDDQRAGSRRAVSPHSTVHRTATRPAQTVTPQPATGPLTSPLPLSGLLGFQREFHQTRTRDGLFPCATMAGIAVCADHTVAADSRRKFRERLAGGLAAYLKVPVWPGVLLLQSHPMRKNRIGCDCV